MRALEARREETPSAVADDVVGIPPRTVSEAILQCSG
jgi:hypothetical protein